MDIESAYAAMRDRIPVWGPRPFRPLLIESIWEDAPHGARAQLREVAQMGLVVNAQDPTAFVADLKFR